MAYTESETKIVLHAENSVSCKLWQAEILPDPSSPGKWYVLIQNGKSTSKTTGTPKFLPGTQTREYAKGSSFADAAAEWMRRTTDKLKPADPGLPDYEVQEKNVGTDLYNDLAASSPRLGGTGTSTSPKASASSLNRLVKKLETLAGPNNDFKIPVLLDGPPGTGKTHSIREFGRHGGFHCYKEVAGNSSMEAIDLFGALIPIGGGKMMWQDGPITAAFREAAKGKKVCLGIDELLRIPRRERSTLLNALSPHEGMYRLRTGNPINLDEKAGVCGMEYLSAPVANLSVIATTNSGSNYPDIESDDPAGRERWLIVVVRAEANFVRSLVESRLTLRGLPTTWADEFCKAEKAVSKVAEDNFCEKKLSPRMVLQAIDLFSQTAKKDKAALKESLVAMIPGLTGRTPEGLVIEDQEKAIETALKTAVGI